ncbi:MAG: translation initiation factor [Bdellovibrionota bacterium]
MTEQKLKKKSIQLHWEGGILNTTAQEAVRVKNTQVPQAKKTAEIKKISGRVSIRTEKKGRAGSPVSILFKFSDPEAKNNDSLKQLCSELKTKLACGGTVENGEIILMMRDVEKLKKVLVEKFGIN